MRVLGNLSMIKGKRRQLVYGKPGGIRGVSPGLERLGRRNQGIVSDGDYATSGIAFGIAESVELFEVHLIHARFLSQLASRCCIERFRFTHKAAGKRITILKGFRQTPDQQQVKSAIADRK